MHALFLVNEGTAAVIVMSVALATAFLMVVALGAYVLYCDAQNRAGERQLVAGDGDPIESHPVVVESHAEAPAADAETLPHPAPRRRPRK